VRKWPVIGMSVGAFTIGVGVGWFLGFYGIENDWYSWLFT